MQVLEAECGVRLRVNDRELTVEGENDHVQVAVAVLQKMLEMIARKEPIDKSRVRYAISLAREGQAELISEMMGDVVLVTHRGKQIKCRTVGQKKYIDAIRKNSVVFAVGPAGTGKTYIAIALAVRALKNREIKRIILTRPAVEAGERLGFLPGDLKDKLDPYLQPLYDALGDMIPGKRLQEFMAEGTIQIAPLAYMRGRTLDRACVILDEAQNTNLGQLKMFLTRMGCDAKFIVTGDASQIDLPNRKDSGLLKGTELTKDIKGIKTIRFRNEDIVRHPLVAKIVKAFEKGETAQ
jgi:phosphate starvation-inducible PhoH-like protein